MNSRPILAILFALLACGSVKGEAPVIKTVEFEAPSVARKMKFNIALPADYDSSGNKRYLVVYLLHGFTSNYTAWAKLGAGRSSERLDMIVVMPDVGNSWYCNWAQSDEGQKNNWEDFIVKDLVGYVDKTYRTIAKRDGRAINGLSMGGYGALTLGLRHPDLFCSIGSQSGALSFGKGIAERIKAGQDLTKARRTPSTDINPDIKIEGFSSQAERTLKGKLFVTAEDALKYDPFTLVATVPRDMRCSGVQRHVMVG